MVNKVAWHNTRRLSIAEKLSVISGGEFNKYVLIVNLHEPESIKVKTHRLSCWNQWRVYTENERIKKVVSDIATCKVLSVEANFYRKYGGLYIFWNSNLDLAVA